MKRRSAKRGRPPLGAAARIRATFTLRRETMERLAGLARGRGASRSRTLEELVQGAAPARAHPFVLPSGALEGLCQRRGIAELWLFGSALRPDFRADSDIDLLARFSPGACRSYFDFVETQQELEALFGRKVDLAEEALLDNPVRRAGILSHRERLYAA